MFTMKALNVFGIIFAWILSIAMVVMLVAAPLALSTLSMLDPENIVELVGEAFLGNDESTAAASQKDYSVEMLSAKNNVREENSLAVDPIDESAAANDVLGGLMDSIQAIVGEEVNEEVLNKVLESDLAGELLDAYMGDAINSITGKPGESQFTAEKLVEVVKDNVDEIVEIMEESGMTLSQDQKTQLKTEINKVVQENAEDIVSALPTPEDIKEAIVKDNEGLEIAFAILAKKNQIKGMIVGAIVLISVLIFGLRYPGFRGLRWLSTNLFTAGGFNVVICLLLGAGSTAALGAEAGMNAIGGSPVAGIISKLLSQLAAGVVIRTVIIFVAAIALLVGYILLKIFVRKKRAQKEESVGVETIFEPAPIPAAAPVYTAVTIETERMSEPVPEMAEESAEVAEETTKEAAEGPAPAENEN